MEVGGMLERFYDGWLVEKCGAGVPAMFGRNLRDFTFELNFRASQLNFISAAAM
jgi:hypothetical protein